MYFDEKGAASMDKAALLNDLAPMPTGYSGGIRIVRPTSHIEGNIAILSYDPGRKRKTVLRAKT